HQAIEAIPRFVKIFATPAPTLRPREKPSSRPRKPTCMKKTSAVPKTSQKRFNSVARSVTLLTTDPLSIRSGSTANAEAGARRPARTAVAATPTSRAGRRRERDGAGGAIRRDDGAPGVAVRVQDIVVHSLVGTTTR